MIGEVSIDGVYVPSLLLFVCTAIVLTSLLTRLLSLFGLYRLAAFPLLAEIAIFVLVLALIVWCSKGWGLRA